MATVRSTPTLLFFLTLLLTASPSPSLAYSSHYRYRNLFSLAFSSYYRYRNLISRVFFSFHRYQNLLSLSHSLVASVANLRAERGDIAGAERARAIADKLEWGCGFGFWRFMWTAGPDYTWLSRWREKLSVTELYGADSDMSELLKVLTELTRMESAAERSAWIAQNYQHVLTISKSLSRKLFKAFVHSGAVREVVETLQIEVAQGRLLRDSLELGTNELKAVKDLALQFFPLSDKRP